jgi:hypothetical protein
MKNEIQKMKQESKIKRKLRDLIKSERERE